MVVRCVAVIVLGFCCSPAGAEEKVEIPLKDIWAHDMPGTKNIHELEGTPSDNPLMTDISKRHRFKTWQDNAGPAFAVEGTELEALKNGHAVLTGEKPRSKSVKFQNEISIVFFTLYTGCCVHLQKVEVIENDIRITYEVIPHFTKELTQHFAIIPVGKLGKGKFDVTITPLPPGRLFAENGLPETLYKNTISRVSSSFDFSVVSGGNKGAK